MDLKSALSSHSEEIYDTLSVFFKNREQNALAIDPLIGQSTQILHTFTLRGGKNIRSFIARLSYMLAEGSEHPGLSQALASIELHHRHLLILDDIFDSDERRYGGPTVEYTYRELLKAKPNTEHMALSMAMMDGVLLGAYSKEILLDSGFDPLVITQALRLYDNQMIEQTLAGLQIHAYQCLDTIEETTPERFVKGLELVTARYTFEAPLLLGLLFAKNRNSKLESPLKEFAKQVGTAFQIHDDILGLFGDPLLTGKPVGNDVREGKKTLLVHFAYHHSGASEKQILQNAVGNRKLTQKEVETIQKVVMKSGALDDSKRMEKELVEKGIKALAKLPPSTAKELLIALAHYVIEREK